MGLVFYDEDGIRCCATIDQVETVEAFKRDRITIDEICIEVRLIDGTRYVVGEDSRNTYQGLVWLLETRLLGFRMDWFDVVAFPAFQENRTLLFSRYATCDDVIECSLPAGSLFRVTDRLLTELLHSLEQTSVLLPTRFVHHASKRLAVQDCFGGVHLLPDAIRGSQVEADLTANQLIAVDLLEAIGSASLTDDALSQLMTGPMWESYLARVKDLRLAIEAAQAPGGA